MNRENKRNTFEKGYYKTHACRDAFTCKVCGRLCTPENAGSQHRNHCPNCLSSLHVDVGTERPTAAASWSRWLYGCAGTVSGPSSTGADAAARCIPTARQRMTTP